MKNAQKKILTDATKSTLFGRFYEKIISGWLREEKGFTIFDVKPRIYWKDVGFIKGDSKPVLRLNEVLKKYKNEKQFCTPDGFLNKDGEFYIWEAKNWPLYSGGKEPFNQLEDLLFSMPLILATKAVYRKQEYNIRGILFSWWSEPEGSESLLKEVRALIAPNIFDIFYTDDALEECILKKYSWYSQIIKEEKERADELFKDLIGP